MGLKTQQGIVIYSDKILNGEKLQALIQKITPECITIYIPINNIIIEKNTILFINFWDDQATYEFKSVALNSKQNKENLLDISRPTTLKKIFNRSFPRINAKITAAIYDFEGINRTQCIIADLSAGGAMVTAKIGRKQGDLVKLAFSLPNEKLMEDVPGKIVWIKPEDRSFSNYGIQFQLSEIRRKILIKFINEELKKGNRKE
ncbi:MAG: PilZ domain-containing protein [Spirochaetes bacterium]|nr:PilZ domain-containing protein [Spirochaetota bacterium]